jgi:hypothetical protein
VSDEPADVVRRPGAGKTLADMVRSLGLVAVVIAGLLFLGPARSLIFPGKDRMPAADYTGTVLGFRKLTHVAPLVPAGLPSSWRANATALHQVRGVGLELHIGFAVPGTRYAGLDETTGSATGLDRRILGKPGLATRGVRTIRGQLWTVRRSARGETAFTVTIGTVSVVVTGNATDAELARLAAALES